MLQFIREGAWGNIERRERRQTVYGAGNAYLAGFCPLDHQSRRFRNVRQKSQIQALDRTQPGLPMKKGRAGTMTHDYKRNGTTTKNALGSKFVERKSVSFPTLVRFAR